MKFGLKTLVVAAVLYVLGGLWVATRAFHLLNTSSDAAVFGGAIILLGIAVLTLALIRPFIRLTKNAIEDARGIGREIKSGRGTDSLMAMALMLGGALVAGGGYNCACERIDAGHAGIKINLAGDNRGVDQIPLVTGWVWYNPISEDVLEYPTYVQTGVWTRDPNEGSPKNEELSFNSKEGLIITGDISLSYQLDEKRVPAFYVKFRSDQLDTFTHGFLRNIARDVFNEVAGTYSVEDLYGPRKEEFVRQVKERINAQVAEIGVKIEQFGFIGAPRPPEAVTNAINAKIAATQQAMQVENEIRRAKAEAEKKVAEAEGAAKSQVARAEGEAKANAILAASITDRLIQWRQLEIAATTVAKWNGARPMVEGNGSGLLFQLPAATQVSQPQPAGGGGH